MTIETGVQLHLPSYHGHKFPKLFEIANAAHDANFNQVWVTDNLECRNTFVVLAAFASAIPDIKLGTAIMAQYFRSPIEAATSIAAVSELLEGREIDIGVGTGNPFTSRNIEMPKPVGFMRQTAQCLRRLLDGERVAIKDYPLLQEYFRFNPDAKLNVEAKGAGPIGIYGGGNGPLGLNLAGELMDGLLFGWTTLPNYKLGLLDEKVGIANAAAEKAGKAATFARVTELKISIARNHKEARRFVRDDPSCARRTLGMRNRGYSDEVLASAGIPPEDLDRVAERFEQVGPHGDFSDLVTDAMIDLSYVAGDPAFCVERMELIGHIAEKWHFQQIIFSELGPDQVQSIKLISEHVVPVLNAIA